jgi:hypothetical protein
VIARDLIRSGRLTVEWLADLGAPAMEVINQNPALATALGQAVGGPQPSWAWVGILAASFGSEFFPEHHESTTCPRGHVAGYYEEVPVYRRPGRTRTRVVSDFSVIDLEPTTWGELISFDNGLLVMEGGSEHHDGANPSGPDPARPTHALSCSAYVRPDGTQLMGYDEARAFYGDAHPYRHCNAMWLAPLGSVDFR